MALSMYDSWMKVSSTPQQTYKDDLQSLINEQFENASNIETIQEETVKGTGIYEDVEVRIIHEITNETGEKLGDDYRGLIFQDITHARGMGYRYSFSDNIWLTTNSDNYKYVTASTVIRRCNNVLRFYDNNGNKVQEPCIIDYSISSNTNDYKKDIIVPKGMIHVTCQYNDNTKQIIANKRFLIGDPRVAYKVRGDGINNFINQNTYDDSSTPLIEFDMEYDLINNDLDDLVNGYAYTSDVYSIVINQGAELTQKVGFTEQLTATVFKNGIITNIPVTWYSTNDSICRVSYFGNITLLSLGTCKIICSLEDNDFVSASITITASGSTSNIVQFNISPNETFVYQLSTQKFDCSKTVDGVVVDEQLTIQDLTTDIPSGYYTFSTSNNSFTINNLKYYTASKVHIQISDNAGNSRDVYIQLKGLY